MFKTTALNFPPPFSEHDASGTVLHTKGTKTKAERWLSVVLLRRDQEGRTAVCGGEGGVELEMLCNIWEHPSPRQHVELQRGRSWGYIQENLQDTDGSYKNTR